MGCVDVKRPRTAAGRLVLLRHGQSEWNAKNVFTGWADPPLTMVGEGQAVRAGRLLREHGLAPDVVHTSLLRRTIATADLASLAAERPWVPVRRSWRLNGRHYGALQGVDKDDARARFGARQVESWRRSFAVAPPMAAVPAGELGPTDPRYAALPPELLPRTESLSDTLTRLLPYWHDALVPDLRTGACVLVVSHGNALRALLKHLDRIGDAEIERVTVPHGVPMLYEFDDSLRPVRRGGAQIG